MRNITPEEKAAMITRPMKRQGYVRTMLLRMKLNELLLIEQKDWTWKKKTPAFLCRRIEAADATYKFECERILGGSGGWIVTRVK